ncbi:MAG: DUF554 family protein [Anaerolineae bacterium]
MAPLANVCSLDWGLLDIAGTRVSSIERGDYSVLAIKSILDGVSALASASAMGAGVLFAAVPLFAYQGSITLLAGLTERLLSEGMVTEMTAAGGVIILGIGLRLLQIKQVRVANFLPALLLAPLLAAVT